jgi:hypothetical protein
VNLAYRQERLAGSGTNWRMMLVEVRPMFVRRPEQRVV